MTNRALLLWFIIAFVCYAYLSIAVPSCLQFAEACGGNLREALLAPFRYRVLQPLIEHAFSDGSFSGILYFDTLLQMALTAGTLTGLYLWLKRIATPSRAMGGVLIFAVVWIVSFSYYFRSIGTSIELCLIVWFMVLIEARLIWLVLLVVVGSLNRETAVLLPLIYFAHPVYKRYSYSGLMLTWMFVTGAIHIALGYADRILSLQETFAYNMQYLDTGFLALFLLLPLCCIVVLQYRAAKPAYKRLAWVAGVYLVATLTYGAWNEMLRLGLTAIILTLPIVIGNENGLQKL